MHPHDLLHESDEGRAHTTTLLARVSPTTIVYPDSGWRVQDVVAHLTHWEEQTLLTMQHALRGERYFLPDFRELGIDGFNASDYERHKQDATDQIMAHFDHVRQQLKAFISTMTDAQWQSSLRWFGSDQSPASMIQGILWHEKHHMADIAALTTVE